MLTLIRQQDRSLATPLCGRPPSWSQRQRCCAASLPGVDSSCMLTTVPDIMSHQLRPCEDMLASTGPGMTGMCTPPAAPQLQHSPALPLIAQQALALLPRSLAHRCHMLMRSDAD